MRLRVTIVSALGLGLSALVGCGGAGSVDFFDASGGNASGSSVAGSRSAAGGASAGAPSLAAAGALSSGGAVPGGPSDTPCSPVIDVTDKGNQMSGEFQNAGPVCLLISDDIVGWGCSNFEGRTVKVNGVEVSCAELPLPDKLHGGYYFDISAGEHAYASLYWY